MKVLREIIKGVLRTVLVWVGLGIPIWLAPLAPYLGGWYVVLGFGIMYVWFTKVLGYKPNMKEEVYKPEEDAGGL